MIFTFFYMYATVIQWWRLSALKNKLNGTLNSKNALLLCDETVIYDAKKTRSFENLLFRNEERIGCTVVPKQKINLSNWILFPKDFKYFPIYFRTRNLKLESPNVYVVIEAVLDTYVKHSANILQIENYGELIAWRASDAFEAILKTDMDKLTRLVHCFSRSTTDMNHELQVLRIETVEVEGFPTRIKYEKPLLNETSLKYSYNPVAWTQFAGILKNLYAKIRDTKNPKIMIETGKTEDVKKVPVSEVKPIKKDGKRTEDRNTLEVGSGDYRRHKSGEHQHRREKSSEKTKNELSKTDGTVKVKDETKPKKIEDKHKIKDDAKHEKEKVKREEHKHKVLTESAKHDKDRTKRESKHEEKHKLKDETKHDTDRTKKENRSEEHKEKHYLEEKTSSKVKKDSKDKHKRKEDKDDRQSKKNEAESSETKKTLSKRATSSDKKLTKSVALCEDIDFEKNLEECKLNYTSSGHKNSVATTEEIGNAQRRHMSKGVKPPNILIYAESSVTKDNVKKAFMNMLNKDRYTIYDLPTDPKQTMWNDSTVLVVVCGNVPPNLTFHLLQYLLTGGQLLCLCSDFLYSVLHTFTTAEVREHELVLFSYSKWKQVKMMHHIFCYQASPTKKQFSKDSDHSNHSNGSSPVAPRTPSTVEIQHNGKDYMIQVQVLGTEETWQTPSLLLATVKGGTGRAVFSQVHLEINPDEFEDDESKFEALKNSDQARMEILKDILINQLELDCSSSNEVEYTSGYFLGRHDLKLNFFANCEAIKDKKLDCRRIAIQFCGKDEIAQVVTSSFMPVFIHLCPSNFSTVNYFETLATEHIGRLVIYSDVMACSQFLLDKTLTHGIVVIPRQQTNGLGRSNNLWLSPVGSALFSLQLHIPLNSPLGQALPLIQHLAGVAVISAVKGSGGRQDLDVGIKWPNDLYANKNIKIGGVLVTSSILDKIAIVNIGCGVNLDNSNPTTCINDLIRESIETKGTNMKPITYEGYFASVFNEFERIYKIVQEGNLDYFYNLYYKYWLHNESVVTVSTSGGESINMTIVGIDEFGFLKVKDKNGEVSTIHPDGNTFDMLKGLISRKTF